MPDHSARIQQIDQLLATGVTRTVNDGQTVEFDPASLREERDRLLRENDATKDTHRPRMRRFRFDGGSR